MQSFQNSIQKKYLFIERKSAEIIALLRVAPIYKKTTTVRARPAKLGQVISTILENGLLETPDNRANEGDWVVTNPNGEQYIVEKEIFFSRYKKTNTNGEYLAIGYCRAISNPFNKPIEILALWGKPEYGEADCMLADTCDENGLSRGEPYIIQHKAFIDTYQEKIN